MKVVYSSAISTAFAVTDSVSSHVLVFTACQFGILFVALIALSLFLLKAFRKRRSRSDRIKSQCLPAIEYPTKSKFQGKKSSPHKKQEVKEVRPRLSKKAKKRLRAAANDKKTPLPVTSLTQQPDKDDILKAIENVSSRDVFVECKEKKVTPSKKVRKPRGLAVQNISRPAVPVAAATALPVVVKTISCDKPVVALEVVSQTVGNRKSRRPRRRAFTLNDFILRKDMHLDAYVQTYRV